MRFNPPPGWPVPPGWVPPPNWSPDPSWPPAPPGWRFWLESDGSESGYVAVQPKSSTPILIAGAAAVAVAIAVGGLVWAQTSVNDGAESSGADATTYLTTATEALPQVAADNVGDSDGADLTEVVV